MKSNQYHKKNSSIIYHPQIYKQHMQQMEIFQQISIFCIKYIQTEPIYYQSKINNFTSNLLITSTTMHKQAIICDPGTGYMKMGFAGDNFPKATFASLVGRPMLRVQQNFGDDIQLKEIMIGNEASKYRSLLQLSHPTEEGIVKNWQDMALLMKYSFQQIGIHDPRGESVFLTQAIMNPLKNKAGMAEIMFEQFQVGRIQYGMQALMPLFAQGLYSAMLLDSGDGVTHCIPVFEGNIMVHSFERLDLAGRHVTNQLIKLLHARGYAFNSSSDFELVREIKEKFCFASGDIELDKKLANQTTIHEKSFQLPDKQVIKLGRERFMAPQILFNPSLTGLQTIGCGQMVFKSINNCQMSLRKTFYKNILISGGTSMIPGFPTRLRQEVHNIYKTRLMKGGAVSIKIQVLDPPARRYNVFIGASIQAKTSENYKEQWKTKQEYDEKGKDRIAREMTQLL